MRVQHAAIFVRSVQLPKRSALDPTATEDEYRNWSDEDESFDDVDSPQGVSFM